MHTSNKALRLRVENLEKTVLVLGVILQETLDPSSASDLGHALAKFYQANVKLGSQVDDSDKFKS